MTAHLVRYRDARDAAVVCWVTLLPALRDVRHEAHLSLTRAALLDRLIHATDKLTHHTGANSHVRVVERWLASLPGLRGMRDANLHPDHAALLEQLIAATERLDDAYTDALYHRPGRRIA